MGYNVTVKGKITFHPPISVGYASMRPELSKFTAESEHETDLKLTASGRFGLLDTIHCPTTWSFRAYDLHNNLHEIVQGLKDGHFAGRLELYGEETGDVYGYRVKNGQVELIEPELVWPED